MSKLANYIAEKRQQKPILSMTHVVYGYPTVQESLDWMATLLEAGADFIAVSSGVWSHPDGPASAVSRLSQLCQEHSRSE